jgi:hypothetical protein
LDPGVVLVAEKAEEWDKVPVKVLVAAKVEVEKAGQDTVLVVIASVPNAELK